MQTNQSEVWKIIKMSSYVDKKGSTAPGSSTIYKETTVPLAVQPKNVIDTTEVSTPYSKKKQVQKR